MNTISYLIINLIAVLFLSWSISATVLETSKRNRYPALLWYYISWITAIMFVYVTV